MNTATAISIDTTTRPNNVFSFAEAYAAKHPKTPNPAATRDTGTTYRKDGAKLPEAADAITDRGTLNMIKDCLLRETGRYGYRNYMIFVFGCNVGRRCGDILKLQIRDVYDFKHDTILEQTRYYDQKTKTYKYMYFSGDMRQAIREYISSLGGVQPTDYLFPSQKGGTAMGTRSFCRILREVKEKLDLTLNLSTHTMRKTSAMNFYLSNDRSIGDTCLMLGHKSPAMTMRYLKLENDYMLDKMRNTPML